MNIEPSNDLDDVLRDVDFKIARAMDLLCQAQERIDRIRQRQDTNQCSTRHTVTPKP